MPQLLRNPWIRRSAAALVTVVGLCLASASQPAQARVWVGFNFGVPLGYAPGYYYYPPPPYPVYYGYPVYRPHWRWRRWCRHHPYRCYW